MRFRLTRTFLMSLVIGSTATMIACGGRQATSPAAPSSAAPAAAPAASAGATISGTVVGVSAPSGWTVHSAPLTVSVSGSTMSTSVDSSGHFTLQNVPSGHVDLHFTGSGVDAHLALDGVADHSTLTITVRVSGSSAQLEDDRQQNDDGHVELEGLVTSVGSSSLMVAGRTVNVTSSTEIVHGDTHVALSSIHMNDRVHVKGTATSGTAPVVATKIEVQNTADKPGDTNDDDHGDNNSADIKGTIVANSFGGSCSAHSLFFKVGTTTIKTNQSTQFEDTTCSGLKAGDAVEIEGTKQTDGSVLAAKVEKDE